MRVHNHLRGDNSLPANLEVESSRVTMTISAILLHEQGDEGRSCERFRVRFGAVRLDAAADAPDLIVHDVSASGFLLQTDAVLPCGTQIIVELPGAIFRQACILWSSNDFYGAQFSKMLEPAELEQILMANPVVWPDLWEGGSITPGRLTQCQVPPPHLQLEQLLSSELLSPQERLPLTIRLRIIFGATALLWATGAAGVFWATA
jgi:hypothetical protein